MRKVDFQKCIPVSVYKDIYFDKAHVSGYKNIYFDELG